MIAAMAQEQIVPPMTPVRRLFAIDTRSLALFRMALAAWIVLQVSLRLPDLPALLADGGAIPRATVLAHTPPPLSIWSVYLIAESPLAQAILACAQLACAVLLFFGWRTRLMAFASWLFLVSLEARNPLTCSGYDALAQLLAFWAMFVPMGAALSVDRALSDEPRETSVFSAGSIALLAQVALLYVFAGLHKYQSPAWQNGTAMITAFSTPEYVNGLGRFIRLSPALLTALTYAVVYFEVLGPLALFSPVLHVPLRAVVTLAFVVMQVGFGACLAVTLFPFISIAGMAAFVPPEFWSRFPWFERALERVATAPAQLVSRFGHSRPAWGLARWERGLIAALTLYVALWNLATLDPRFLVATSRRAVPLAGRGYRPPHWVCWLGLSLRLNQAMTMFTEVDGAAEWNEVRVRTATGTTTWYIDGGHITREKPPQERQFTMRSLRWGNFWTVIPAYPWAHTHTGAYLCRRLRAEHPDVRHLELTVYRTHQRAPGAPLKRFGVFGHLCAVEDGELEP